MEVNQDRDMKTPAEAKAEIEEAKPKDIFKKPVLVGKIGKLPRKIESTKSDLEDEKAVPEETKNVDTEKEDDIPPLFIELKHLKDTSLTPVKTPAQQLTENSMPLPYKEPSWSGLPRAYSKDYAFEVLKSGVIVERIDLASKPFWVFGRSPKCEICMAHPTISRFHAVLQYRREGTEEDPPGFYIYDLSSTHGTFLNKGKLKPRVYAPVKVGHMIKLGFSTRCYVLTGPDEDVEEESQFTLTELKQQRAEKLLQQELAEKEALLKEEKEKEERRKRDEERGIDWGLGEDAEEEADLAENPYAQTNNEELYIEDPKKALRGFMEREGYDLEYDCTEQGFGQFFCKVELPIDDDRGRPIVAEVLHKGKKKEAVIQCALEACRILDRYGLLRQATHESRKRKAKNWEENDYYDSDDDTFLDRTGAIEKKREKRMQSKVPQQPETYQSLLEKEKQINQKILELEQRLSCAKTRHSNQSSNTEEDPLDSFMNELKQSKLDKQTVSKLKSELIALKAEHVNVVKLANLAKPADLPTLVVNNLNVSSQQGSSGSGKVKGLPLFGKRSKVKVQLPAKPTQESMKVDNGEEDDETEEEKSKKDAAADALMERSENSGAIAKINVESSSESASSSSMISTRNIEKKSNIPCHIKIYRKITELEKLISENEFPSALETYVNEIQDTLQKVKELTEHEGRIQSDKKTIMAKNRKVQKHIDNLMESYDHQYLVRICKECRRICVEICNMIEAQHKIHQKIRILGMKIDLLCVEVLRKVSNIDESKSTSDESHSGTAATVYKSKSIDDDDLQHSEDEDEIDKDDDRQLTPEELEKRKRRNQRRIQYRKERAELEKQKGYQEDARKQDYNMWVPPKNQTGDGSTSLNEKYGY